MRVISLGSGSGNALLVQSGETSVLVDAGFQPRARSVGGCAAWGSLRGRSARFC